MKYSNILLVPLLCVAIQTVRGDEERTTQSYAFSGNGGSGNKVQTVQHLLRLVMDNQVQGMQQGGVEQQNIYSQNQDTSYMTQDYGQQKSVPYAQVQYGQKKQYKYVAPKYKYKQVKVYRPKAYVYNIKPIYLEPTHHVRQTYEVRPPLKFFYTSYDAAMARIHVAPTTMHTTIIKTRPRVVPVVKYFKGPHAFNTILEPEFSVIGMGKL